MDEKEFRTWITRIQALRDETSSSPSTSKAMTQSEIDDDVSQDLVAAFRYAKLTKNERRFMARSFRN